MVNPNGLRVIGTDEVTAIATDTTQYVKIPRRLNIEKQDLLPAGTPDGIIDNAILDFSTIDDSTLGNNANNDVSLTTYSVPTDGRLTATYSNGDRITVRTNAAGTNREIVFTRLKADQALQ